MTYWLMHLKLYLYIYFAAYNWEKLILMNAGTSLYSAVLFECVRIPVAEYNLKRFVLP